MDNSLTRGMKLPQRAFGASLWEGVRRGAALFDVGVIHHANTAGGRRPGAALCRAGRE